MRSGTSSTRSSASNRSSSSTRCGRAAAGSRPIAVDADASSVTRLDDGGARTERVELRTNLGEMGVILVDGEDVSFDTTLLDLSTVTDGAVPDRYTGVPEGTRPLLFTTDGRDGFEFRRDATAQEKSALSKRTGIPESRINANLESERGGFVVADVEADDDDYTVLQLDDFVFHEVSPSVVADATVVDDPVTPDLSWWCRYKCGNCLAKAAKCLGCCVATSLGCIVCIIWQCGLGAKSCYDCHGCLK